MLALVDAVALMVVVTQEEQRVLVDSQAAFQVHTMMEAQAQEVMAVVVQALMHDQAKQKVESLS
jgi:hypothetical protein